MKKIATFLVGCLLAAVPVHSNATGLSLKELCAGEYAAKRIYGVNPLNDGESYSRLSDDHKQIITYSFKDGRQKDVLFDVSTARDVKLEKIDGYILSPDEKKMLIQTETKPSFLHRRVLFVRHCQPHPHPLVGQRPSTVAQVLTGRQSCRFRPRQ